MSATRTFTFVTLATMALGIGSAMAQSESASMPTGFYGVVHVPTWSHQPAVPRVQAGSSDADAVRSGAHGLLFNGDYGTIANPG